MFLVFDIGGSKIRLGASRDGLAFAEAPKEFETPQNFEEGIALIKKTAGEFAGNEKIEGVVGGVAGILNKDKSELARAPHLLDWAWKPLKQRLEKELEAPVRLENDSALVGLGEAYNGAGKGFKIVAYLTISTGVGGARIVNGKIGENSLGFEPGHQIIDPNGPVCLACGVKGHLEAFISGHQVGIKYNMKPYEISDEKVWEELSGYLAIGINNILVHWSPDVVVLGGSMMKKVGIPIERVREHLKEISKIFPAIPPLEHASLGDFGGLYGGLALLRETTSS
ncbi:MAG: ROK family protein [Candidatus Liptonbacteria bacterium]|nr:ROK family protein [Candidatus Liptonbacteria bacterium]